MPCAATWPNGASATRPETTVIPASTSTPNPSTSTSSPANATGRGGGMVIGGGSTGTLTRARLPSGARSVDVGPRAHRWRTRQPNLERSRRANTEFDVGCRTMRALLIVNPHATSTNERRRDLLAHALAGELSLRVAHTESRGHGVDADPTVATEQILEALAAHRVTVVSLGRADDRYFTFNAGLGLDAEAVHAVEKRRHTGSPISNFMHFRMTVSGYFKSDRKHPRMTVELPGRDPIEGAYLAFVSNVDPWTYFGQRPVRTNPGTSPTGGLGFFTMTKVSAPTALRASAEILRANAAAKSSKSIIRAPDVDWVTVRCKEPVDLQADGDYLGTRSEVEFVSVPHALRLVL